MIIVICCIIAVIAATVGIWFCTTGEKSEPSANNRENNLNLSEMEDENTYVGGITYTAKITNLQAGDSQIIQPSHYLKDSSRIMMVRTYDTAE